ncbi:hypothetical protein [Nonomuraea rhodomycinica]|uniref:Adhesin n=1 Tax=Nonomuraea rhodomycinica TaxID=1712872 RepID=A0A7Y6IND7_9ACTN|nr:hypothetical protein [Nonomuraea rhodomycinica]NUW41035.1 hypothetical protein [Nonomuraea rhodomycinica]
MRRILGAMAAASAVAVLATVTSGCGVELDAKEVHDSHAFTHAGGQLTVRSSTGGLRILPGEPGAVRVERWVRGKAAGEGNASWSLKDGVLRLGADCTMVFGDCGARYHVRVPPGVRLVVEGSEEGVILQDLAQDADVSSHGPIKAYGASGRLRLNGDHGLVEGERLKSASVRVRTRAGAVRLAFAMPPSQVDVVSDHGYVRTTVPKGAYRVTAQSRYGDERSEVEDVRSERTIVAKSTSGNIDVLAR